MSNNLPRIQRDKTTAYVKHLPHLQLLLHEIEMPPHVINSGLHIMHIILFVLHLTKFVLFAFSNVHNTFALNLMKYPPYIKEKALHITKKLPYHLAHVPHIRKNVPRVTQKNILRQ